MVIDKYEYPLKDAEYNIKSTKSAREIIRVVKDRLTADEYRMSHDVFVGGYTHARRLSDEIVKRI